MIVVACLDDLEIDWGTFQCVVIPGKAGPYFTGKEKYNLIYSWWRDYWMQLMIGLGSSLPSLEEFYRQDYVVAILDNNLVVALLCINQFNLDCFGGEHPYFEKFNSDFWTFMDQHKIKNVYSGQWITVNDAYAARKTRINFAAVILGLGHEVYKRFSDNNSALITVARKDLASANTARKFGWMNIGEPFELHNVKCEQLAMPGHPKPHNDPKVNHLVEYFWGRRVEYSRGYSKQQSKTVSEQEEFFTKTIEA